MAMWHVGNPTSDWGDDDGWVVLAESADEAVRIVEAAERAFFEKHHPGGSDEEYRRWHGAKWPHEWNTLPVDPPAYRIPFLGYTW